MKEVKNMPLQRGAPHPLMGLSWALPCLLALLAGLSGCARRKETASDPGASVRVTSAAPPGASTTSTAAAASAPPPPYGLALADRLSREAAARPTDTPKAEDVLAAVAKSGVPLEDQEQHLASPIGASFCIGAKSSQNVAMSACEYANVAAAVAGRDMSQKAFEKVLHRDIVVNKKTTLTILQAPFDAQSRAAHDKAIVAFKAM
jgi:hypothetical protein